MVDCQLRWCLWCRSNNFRTCFNKESGG